MSTRPLFVAALLFTHGLPAQADIFECVDDSGNRRFTNIKSEAKGCKTLNVAPPNAVPPPSPAPGAKAGDGRARAATPSDFPRVDAQTQQRRDNDRRRILEQELNNEQKLLDEARKELADQEGIRLGNERNYQRVLDRVEPYKKRVKLHEDNIANLRKELSGVR
jgi:hypothetical protein